MVDELENKPANKPTEKSEIGGISLDMHMIPILYTWIRYNFLSFIVISTCLLSLYGAYQFIDGYAKSFGSSMVTQHEELKRAVSSYTALDQLIQKPLNRFNASRVVLYRLHDSERDISRMAYFFASVANVVASPGVEIDIASITNLPASLFAPVLPELIRKQPVFLHIKDMPSSALKELEFKRGSRTTVFLPITDLNESLIAFLELNWLSDDDVPVGDVRTDMMISLESDCTRISGYFSLSKLIDK